MIRWWMVAAGAALLGLAPAVASAQPGLVPPSQVPPAPAADEEPEPDGLSEDPTLGRGVFLPTAMTLRQGDFTMGLIQPVAPVGILTLSAGITDRIQLTGLLGVAYDDTEEAAFGATAKVRLTDGDITHLSLQAGLGRVDGDDLLSSIGLAASICLSDACRSLISGYLAVGAVHSDGFDEPVLGLSGLSFIGRLSDHLRAVAELEHPMEAGWDEDLFLASYGLRVVGGIVSGELLFVRPLGEELDFPLGLPMLTLTLRTR